MLCVTIKLVCPHCKEQLEININYNILENLRDDNRKYFILCKNCGNVITLNVIEFECIICRSRNLALIPENFQVYHYFNRLPSIDCNKCNYKEKLEKSEKIDWFFAKCSKRERTTIINEIEFVRCINCNAINILSIIPGNRSFEIFCRSDWFYTCSEKISHYLTKLNFKFIY